MKKLLLLLLIIPFTISLSAQKGKVFEVKSRDGSIALKVEAGKDLRWSVQQKGQQIIAPSSISMNINGIVFPAANSTPSLKRQDISTTFTAINYKKAVINDEYSELTLSYKKDFGIVFRVYNDAVAYRFFTRMKDTIIVNNEEANFNFTADHKAFIPYMFNGRDGMRFNCPFESLYTEHNISQFGKDSLAFLPLLVDPGNGKKVVILEADLEDYPGMFLDANSSGGFKGVYAPYPLEAKPSGSNNILIPTKRAQYIAKTSGTRNFPWRAVVISENDRELLSQDIVQKLASPSRLKDISWIEPGQVSWDWWNALNISGVDFRAGMNTDTYRYFIDFASANKIRYLIIDAGWSVRGDITKVIPALNLPEIIKYGAQKGVGVILWATWYDILNQMDVVFPLYSGMGIKGFKIDFFERDDQVVVASTYEIARKAADHHLLVDYHGIYKPTGLQRTYPNVVGYEGVKGLENVKWATEDVPRYDVTIPFIRMMAGPMDYTPGAMRNTNKQNFRALNSNPMSQGTRCHQLAMYVVYEVPLQMMSDNPTIYMREQECTDFITSVPVTFDETVPLNGKVGEYVALARKKGNIWFAGAMTNWTPRELTLDLSFLDEGSYRAVIFRDGVNSDRDATDYKKETINVTSKDKLQIKMMNGGGWAARFEKI